MRRPVVARRRWAAAVLSSLLAAAACGPARPSPAPATLSPAAAESLAVRVDALLAEQPADVVAALWLEQVPGGVVYRRAPSAPLPAASSIKTAYMVELFAAWPDLDAPLPGADAVLDAPGHPALRHFDADTRAEIRDALRGVSVRRLARAMIRGDDVSNAVYNAAANVVTAVLGGPAALTRRLHDRDPAWRGLQVRRYMLAARDASGDNEATPEALAAVLRGIVRGDVPGVAPELYGPMREILAVDSVPEGAAPGSRHFFKSGSLDSDPPVRVLSGWLRRDGRALLYVVVASRPRAGAGGPQETGTELAALAEDLRAVLVDEGWR